MKTAHDVIIRPIITEASMSRLADKKYTFEVASDANKILRTLQALELPLVLPDGIDTATVLQKTASDKKFRAGTIRFVLLSKAGEAGISTKITREDMAEAIEELRRPLD